MYIVKVRLKKDKSFEMRKALNGLGFMICIYDALTNDITVLNEDYSSPEKVLYIDKNISFTCLYNGPMLPPGIVDLLEKEGRSVVISYIVEKRVS